MAGYRAFLRQCIRDNHPLLGAVIACNRQYPARLRKDSIAPRAETLAPLFARDARGSSRLLRRVPLLLAEYEDGGKTDTSWWALDFRVPRHRLALLEPETLRRLADWCGLVRHREQIARLIDREAVLALRAAVGEEGHRFALRRSALLPGAREAQNAPADDALPLPERISRSGSAMLAACLADAPRPVAAMLLRTAPEEFAAQLKAVMEMAPSGKVDVDAFWPLVRTLLFKEIAPAWEPCFT